MLLKNIANWIAKKQNSIFTYPVQKQRAYIEKLGKPRDLLQRSYFQYRCQMKFNGFIVTLGLNLAALPMSVLYLIKFSRTRIRPEQHSKAVYLSLGIPENIIPDQVRQEYGTIPALQNAPQHLDKSDRRFLRRMFRRYPFSWLLWLKTIYKLGQYSALIKQYRPEAIVCCDEYSYASPYVTEYCRQKKVKRINVMHGEKLYFMRDAFVCYDEYYVWDRCYAQVLTQMGGEEHQFRIAVPESLLFSSREPVEKTRDYTYYLAGEERPSLQRIASAMKALQDRGFRVSVRPHPRYTNPEEVKLLFDGIDIEDPTQISIQHSLCRTENAVSVYSTTLNQASHNGIGVVIDDVSDEDRYRKLEEVMYCMLAREHRLLSEVIGENK